MKKLKKRNKLELILFLEKMSNRYPNKVFGRSKITFEDLYNNSDVVFNLQERYVFKSFGDLITVFDIIVDDYRSSDCSLPFEEYCKRPERSIYNSLLLWALYLGKE